MDNDPNNDNLIFKQPEPDKKVLAEFTGKKHVIKVCTTVLIVLTLTLIIYFIWKEFFGPSA